MKILYLSCHSILEYEEVLLLHELGHEVFSPGAYVEPANPGDATLRPAIPGLVYDPDLVALWQQHEHKHPSLNGKSYLHESPEIINQFDVIIVMHYPEFILNNWEAMKHKRVIWRTIGQSVHSTEVSLQKVRNQGMQVVRYSPREHHIPGFIGIDALIRFYKDPDVWKGWHGSTEQVITFGQHMQQRRDACNYNLFEKTTRPFPRKICGPGSEVDLDTNSSRAWGTGKLSFADMHEMLRANRVYFYTGTHPASYTLNFIEAWMTGIPIVAIGPQNGNARIWNTHQLYEIQDLITHGVNGFISDDIGELRYCIKLMMDNRDMADIVSAQARTSAITHFGKDLIKASWKAFLEK